MSVHLVLKQLAAVDENKKLHHIAASGDATTAGPGASTASPDRRKQQNVPVSINKAVVENSSIWWASVWLCEQA